MAERYRVEKWSEPYAPNPAPLRKSMEVAGYRVYEWSDRPGTVYDSHKHAEAQSHRVLSGAIEITVESGRYVLERGDRDFMPANTYHTARVVGDEPVVYLIGEMESGENSY